MDRLHTYSDLYAQVEKHKRRKLPSKQEGTKDSQGVFNVRLPCMLSGGTL